MKIKNALRIIKLVAFVLVCFILIFLVSSIVVSIVTDKPLPTIFGYGACFVVSGSMEPTLSINDIIIVKEIEKPQIDDMVLYQSYGSLVVHRVIRMTEDGETIITQGDANDTPDAPFDRSLIVGKVVCVIPALGQIIAFLKSPYGLITILMFCVILYTSTYILKQYIKEKKTKSR